VRAWAVLALAVALAGCGGGENRSPPATPTPRATATAAPAKPPSALAALGVDPASAKGTVTYCAGEFAGADSEGSAVEQFNTEHETQGLRARFRKLPFMGGPQHQRLFGRRVFERCDVMLLDSAWMGEAVAADLALDLTPYVEARRREFVGSAVDAVAYRDRFWGVPRQVDVGLLYYRTDQVDAPPRTWQEVYDTAQRRDGIVYQGAPYESLTLNFLELAYASGGRVLSDDGRRSAIDSPENLRALELMAGGVKDGAAPAAVTRMQEDPAREAFSQGNATFMRNWPYALALMQQRSEVKDKFKAVELPAFEGGGQASVLVGHDVVVAKRSKNRDAALVFADFLTSPGIEAQMVSRTGAASPLAATYEDPSNTTPGIEVVRRALEQARPRPVTPAWSGISAAIYENVQRALTGNVTARRALQAADRDIDRALAGTATHR
jgi:multiple sugar transport system substrate-binding protein